MTIVPDTKDWTWVLTKACPECGFDATAVEDVELAGRLRDNASAWVRVLQRDDARSRPAPHVWSAVEYACHVRDVHRLYLTRVQSMLHEQHARFDNWDQDQTAVRDDYRSQDPAEVSAELVAAADAVAERYATVSDDGWQRTGSRSDGAEFTVDSIGRYHLHDAVHHLYDVHG